MAVRGMRTGAVRFATNSSHCVLKLASNCTRAASVMDNFKFQTDVLLLPGHSSS